MTDPGMRKRLNPTRPAVTHKVEITDERGQSHDIYITVGFYPDGETPGEIFLRMGKVGGTMHGFMDTIGIIFSHYLQHGLDLEPLLNRLRYESYEPSGKTDNPEIPECNSITDYVAAWLQRLVRGDEGRGEGDAKDNAHEGGCPFGIHKEPCLCVATPADSQTDNQKEE